MAVPAGDAQAQTLLLDIEGTTTPIDFVYQVLFPYARNRIKKFIHEHYSSEDVRVDLARLREEHAADTRKKLAPPTWRDESDEDLVKSVVTYFHWLMDRDRKSTALKSLQGKVWEAGYRSGELQGQVYADVPPAFARWRWQSKNICIFSSGSVLAQQLLFASTPGGDLTRFIQRYFDTTIGPKAEVDSYRGIAAALEVKPSETLFVSDVMAELDAAQAAGMLTALCVRSGAPAPETETHRVVHTFDEISP